MWLGSFREGDWARAEQTVCRESCDAITGDHPAVINHMTDMCYSKITGNIFIN